MTARPDVDLGDVSSAEAAMEQSAAAARAHYEMMAGIARKTREELITALHDGVPRLVVLPSGGVDGAVKMSAVYRLINSFAWANRALFNAASALCDLEHLPEDGAAEAVVWDVPL